MPNLVWMGSQSLINIFTHYYRCCCSSYLWFYRQYNGCCCCRCSGNYVVSTSLLLFLFSLVLLYRILKECFGSLLFSIYAAHVVVVSCNASLFLTNHNGFSWNDFQTSGQRRKKLHNNNNNISSH